MALSGLGALASPADAASRAPGAEAASSSADRSAALEALGRTTLRQPGSRPDPALPEGADTLPGIDHIVILMLENHSFDNFFGMLGRGDGFMLDGSGRPTATNPYADGQLQHAFHMPTTCQLPARPSNEWTASHNSYDGGLNDGFVRTPISPASSGIVGGVAMGYWTGADLPFTYSLASIFPIGDRWFGSCLGQTDPNRRYLIAATSAGMTTDIGTGLGGVIGDLSLVVPANGTIFNQLDAHGISWADYSVTYPNGTTSELFPVNDLVTGTVHRRVFSQFYTDVAGANLPAVALLDPNFDTQSQENPQNIVIGEALLADVVNALAASPLWSTTMLIVNYDEHGGYYDHIPPPPALVPDDIGPIVQPGEAAYDGFGRYGFRVPSVVVSPYSKPDYVSHQVYDHTSILAMIERKWNLPALTYRDANANDLTDFLDLTALAAGAPTFRRLPLLAYPGDTPAALTCSTTGPGTIPPLGSISG